MQDDRQASSTVLLVRPAAFGFHAEAAQSNAFAAAGDESDAAARAVAEFDSLRCALEDAEVRCLVLDDTPDPARPDAVFPNNWVSFHVDGTLIIYPMANAARRLERRLDALLPLLGSEGLAPGEIIDLSALEVEGAFLEGTGSLILDRPRARAFACRSSRTSAAGVHAFEAATGWTVELFDAADRHGRQIYHTNVMLTLGTDFALVCADAIAEADRERVLTALRDEREVITVGFDQMERFACNALELRGAEEPVIALSATALDSLEAGQRAALERFGRLVPVAIPTIERIGGGSVRCMIAELFLPER